MAHLLDAIAGKVSMAWSNEAPWHLSETRAPELHSDATPTEFMQAANLDWTVSKRPMFLADGSQIANHMMLCRDLDDKQFSIVGSEWNPVQNADIFAFYDRFFDAGQIKMQTCGAIKGGTNVWVLASIEAGFVLPGDDEVRANILFHSAHLYGKATTFRTTTHRPVCNNTLGPALRDNKNVHSIPHRFDFTNDEIQKRAMEAVGHVTATMAQFEDAARVLVNTPINNAKVEQVIAEVYQPTLLTAPRVDEAPLRADFNDLARDVLMAVELSPGSRLKSAHGTAWGLLNAVTYVEDHMSNARSGDNALASTWFGKGADRKQAAFDACLRLAA